MRVLVTAACENGSTTQIAETIRCTLHRHGAYAVSIPPDEVGALSGFDAVVLGSALDGGGWLNPALRLVQRHGPEILQRKVWLFSNYCRSDESMSGPHPAILSELRTMTGAVEHRVFPAALGQVPLDFADRATVASLMAPLEKRRNGEIERWAAGIARTLRAESSAYTDWQLVE